MTSLKPSDRLATICTIVCDAMDARMDDVMGKSRLAYVVNVRWACMWACWTYTDYKIGEMPSRGTLANFFGRDHGTINHSLMAMRERLSGKTGHADFVETLCQLATELERMGFKVRRKL